MTFSHTNKKQAHFLIISAFCFFAFSSVLPEAAVAQVERRVMLHQQSTPLIMRVEVRDIISVAEREEQIGYRDAWHRSGVQNLFEPEVAEANGYSTIGGRIQQYWSTASQLGLSGMFAVMLLMGATGYVLVMTRPRMRARCITAICVLEQSIFPIGSEEKTLRILIRLFLLTLSVSILLWITMAEAIA